jgi:hypothetical protein
MKLANISNMMKETSVKVSTTTGEEELKFSYRPNAYTPAIEEATRKATSEATLMGAVLIENLVHVLEFVDLEGADGKLINPKDVEELRNIPISVLSLILNKIGEDMDPGKKKSGDSDGSF